MRLGYYCGHEALALRLEPYCDRAICDDFGCRGKPLFKRPGGRILNQLSPGDVVVAADYESVVYRATAKLFKDMEIRGLGLIVLSGEGIVTDTTSPNEMLKGFWAIDLAYRKVFGEKRKNHYTATKYPGPLEPYKKEAWNRANKNERPKAIAKDFKSRGITGPSGKMTDTIIIQWIAQYEAWLKKVSTTYKQINK